MKGYARSVLYFAGFALLGPVIAAFYVWMDVPMSYFAFILLAQIWPFWMFTKFETILGSAVLLATVWNMVAFAPLGLLAAAVGRSRIVLALLFAVTCAAQLWWFRFAMGASPRVLVIQLALAAATALLAVPFLLVARMQHDLGTT